MQQAQYMHRVCTTWAPRLHSPRMPKRLFPHAFSEAVSSHIISQGKQQHFHATKRMQTAEIRPLGMWVYHVGQPTFTYNLKPPFSHIFSQADSTQIDSRRLREALESRASHGSSLQQPLHADVRRLTALISACGNSHWRGLTTSLAIFVCVVEPSCINHICTGVYLQLLQKHLRPGP